MGIWCSNHWCYDLRPPTFFNRHAYALGSRTRWYAWNHVRYYGPRLPNSSSTQSAWIQCFHWNERSYRSPIDLNVICCYYWIGWYCYSSNDGISFDRRYYGPIRTIPPVGWHDGIGCGAMLGISLAAIM